jgi:4-hydroxybenzoate polyprenyltransferase
VWGGLFRIGFLPIEVVIFSSMAVPVLVGLQVRITPLVVALAALAVATHIFWFCYGTVLNDYWDQDMDRHNPYGQTVFTQGYFSDREKKGVIRFFAVLAFVCELPQFAYIYYTHASNLVDLAAFGVFLATGFVMATAYSMPPVWAKRRLFGPTYTLMLVYVTGFLRFSLLFGGWDFIALNWVYVLGICVFLYIDHMITSVSLKDIPDAYADEKGGARSVPLVLGFRPALYMSIVMLVVTMGAGVLLVLAGWLQWWFLLTYVGVVCYYYLYREMNGYIEEVSKDRAYFYKVPMRKRFLAFGYIMNWGIWIPCFMVAFNSHLLI